MNMKLVPVTIAAIALSAMTAFAADTMTTGKIKSLDMKAGTVTLDTGTAYYLPKGFKDPGLKVGEKVTIGWQMNKTHHQADTVVAAK
jgi:hypothetical protein